MAKPNPMPATITALAENPANAFDAIKVFSATKFNDRDVLGELITRWMDANPGIVIVDKIVAQSSDQAYHCLSITLFYRRAR
jgi:hypothetical protein